MSPSRTGMMGADKFAVKESLAVRTLPSTLKKRVYEKRCYRESAMAV